MEHLFPSSTLFPSHFYQCIRAQSPISSSSTIHTLMGNTPWVVNSYMGPLIFYTIQHWHVFNLLAGDEYIIEWCVGGPCSHWASICSSRCAPRWYQSYTATINDRQTTVWGTLVGGERKIVYSVKKMIHIPNPEHVMIVHPGLLHAKGPWVVIRGEHLGTVVSHIGWQREPAGGSDQDVRAQCEVIHGMPGVVRPLEFQSEDLATIASQEKALMSAS